jgi:hypothetical protein
MRYSLGVLALLVTAAANGHDAANDLLQVSLEQLHPTQAAIGYEQVRYKLGRYEHEPQKAFDDYCEANGQGQATEIRQDSSLLDAASFDCSQAVGTEKGVMKTVVRAPDNQLYLTDGHHTFSSFWEKTGASPAFKVWVRVTDDYSDSKDMDAFWQRMSDAKKVRLKDGQGETVTPDKLPAQLGLTHMQDDPFRSLVYFTRGAAYAKPRSGNVVPEFLEFYWADWLRPQMDLNRFDLTTRSGYGKAVGAAAKLMVSLDTDAPVADSGFNAGQLGVFGAVNRKELNKTLAKKVGYAMAYKAEH